MSDLLQALYVGDRARVDELLAADPKLDLFEAAAFGRDDRLRELLGADPNLRRGVGFRAIDAARQNGDSRVEQLLLEHGAEA